MGRYYYTDNGKEGKFMFGVQPSDDPDYMGMIEQEPTSIDYYADQDNVETIKTKLDEQYDLLGVPKKERIYYCKDQKEQIDFENRVLHNRIFTTVKDDDKEEIEKHEKNDEDRWCSEKEGCTDYAPKEKALMLARIRLALDILSDIEDTGCCLLSAEL